MSKADQDRGREELVRAVAARLAELRRKAGLTQQGVAEAMARERSGRWLVAGLERGAVANASLSSLVEYLRAVRAGFGDLTDVLDRYTSLPVPEAVLKRAKAAPPPRKPTTVATLALPPGARLSALPLDSRQREQLEIETLRVRRRAGYWVLRKVFEHFLHSELTALGIPPSVWLRRRMATYGRKVFNALFRTRGPKEAKRPERLSRLREWAQRQSLTAEIVRYMETIVGHVFEDMREHDELDWLPPPAEAYAIMSVKPKHRVVTDAQMCLAEWWEANDRYARAAQEAYERANKAATDLLPTAGLDARTLLRYKQAAMWATNIGATTVPGTSRRKQSVADFQAADWPPELDRKLPGRILAAALEVLDSARPNLPPAPGPKPR
jgi:hypothetical protein